MKRPQRAERRDELELECEGRAGDEEDAPD
jgi:hypothetical protein